MNSKSRIARTAIVTSLVTAMLVSAGSSIALASPASVTRDSATAQKQVASPTAPVAPKRVSKAVPAPARPYRGAPAIKPGMTKSQAAAHATKWRPFRVQFKYTNGRKDRVVRWAFSSYWESRRKWNSSRTTHLYAPGAKVIVWLGNGKTSARGGKWNSAVVSMYGIGDGFVGKRTASGEVLRSNSMVVAHRSMRMGTKIRFKYRGRTCTAVVKDRGPFIRGRTFDLGPGTARALGFRGVGTVQYQVIGR
jgi:rare lipoprotein A (peptidoglycan hydrolase)